jgi:hypothetical protein
VGLVHSGSQAHSAFWPMGDKTRGFSLIPTGPWLADQFRLAEGEWPGKVVPVSMPEPKGNPIWGLVGGVAYRGELVVARHLEVKKRPAVEWTTGHRCKASGRRGSSGIGEPRGVVSMTRGGREAADIKGACGG